MNIDQASLYSIFSLFDKDLIDSVYNAHNSNGMLAAQALANMLSDKKPPPSPANVSIPFFL
jgi:hypothetical protein